MIHPTAVVSPDAQLGEDVSIGPYAVIDAGVRVGDRCRVGPMVYLTGDTEIGPGCKIHKGAALGDEPQDFDFKASTESGLKLGANCVVREYATVHRGSKPGNVTEIGDECMLMGFSHVGHDCKFGARVVVANHSSVSGYTEIEDNVIISGAVHVHQFCRIGTLSMIGGKAPISQDVPPYSLVNHLGEVVGPNTVGMRRQGFTADERKAIASAFKIYFRGPLIRSKAIEEVAALYPDDPRVGHFVEHVRGSKRGVLSASKKR